MIIYQTEKWRDVLPEMEPMLVEHWLEIALGHDKVPLDVARERYQKLCDEGSLHIVTIRKDGKLIGYHVAIVSGHLHYLSTLHGITDVYFLNPQYRKGFTGIRLFRYAEAQLGALGVKKLFTSAKLHTANGQSGRLFEYLGYAPIETLYSKYIGD